jgi:hypothetical protein
LIQLAIVLEALGVALIILAMTRDDLQRRYPWLG